jgi:hypothetical protein
LSQSLDFHLNYSLHHFISYYMKHPFLAAD